MEGRETMKEIKKKEIIKCRNDTGTRAFLINGKGSKNTEARAFHRYVRERRDATASFSSNKYEQSVYQTSLLQSIVSSIRMASFAGTRPHDRRRASSSHDNDGSPSPSLARFLLGDAYPCRSRSNPLRFGYYVWRGSLWSQHTTSSLLSPPRAYTHSHAHACITCRSSTTYSNVALAIFLRCQRNTVLDTVQYSFG